MASIDNLTIGAGASIRDVLQLIDQNARGICFILEERKLIGVASDGDIRRGLLNGFKLDDPIIEIMNKDFVSLAIDSKESKIRSTFDNRIKLIPLCDEKSHLIDVADARKGHKIPILEPELSGNELLYVEECIKTTWISSQGKFVREFERIFEVMHPGTTALAVSNGTVALHLAMLALDIGPGDEVIVPNLTFAASINAVLYVGATPVICEIDPENWCIDVAAAAKLITAKTKAIMPVHLYGHPCDMDQLMRLANRYDLMVIEDSAEAIGSQWKGQPVGVFGDASTFSFYGNKTVTTGEGGMTLFRDAQVAERAKILRDHGMSKTKRYWHEEVGHNFRLTNLQAAVGVAQMERFDKIIEKKRKIAALYSKHLSGAEGIATLPPEGKDVVHSYWLYTITLVEEINRDDIIRKLLLNGIDTRPVFYPLDEMPPYQGFVKSDSLKHSRKIAKSGISLPSSVTLKEEEIIDICETLKEALALKGIAYL